MPTPTATTSSQKFRPGNLVTARNRLWVVQSNSQDNWLHLRPVGGADDEITTLMPSLERIPVKPANFSLPDPNNIGIFNSGRLLFDALRFQLRSGTGPFRSFASLNFEPRSYQYVPLLMAMRQKTVRLLIADDVGVGKTIEAGMIARELIDRGEIQSIMTLCPPHLVDQWCAEFKEHFNLDAFPVTSANAARIERSIPLGQTLLDEHPIIVVSLDYIKAPQHRDYFLTMHPDLLIVDEAHTCVKGETKQKQLRFEFLQKMLQGEVAEYQEQFQFLSDFDDTDAQDDTDADSTETAPAPAKKKSKVAASSQPAGRLMPKHLLLLTATPHSGKEDAFFSLLSLLDPKFEELKTNTSANSPLRRQLATCFVQRRRKDIQSWSVTNNDSATQFTVRKVSEVTYELNDEWQKFFDDAQTYCFNMLEANGNASHMIYFAVLALFRCISSSPAAASAALGNRHDNLAAKEAAKAQKEASIQAERLQEQINAAEAEGKEALDVATGDDLENDSDAALDESDLEPQLFLQDSSELKALQEQVEKLKGADHDPKLKKVITLVRNLLKDGFSPIIFCRYIATAEYVASELKAKFKKANVACITGNLNPEERKAEVLKIGAQAPRVLVATDCLSEGINLQQFFDAVVHYDLAWNPTRHEQREGRVDRFGQTAPEVRCAMVYGSNNPMDGTVINVILQKSQNIQKELGVLVPVPNKTATINKAILKSILFRKGEQIHQSSFLDDLEQNDFESELNLEWENAANKLKGRATVFAQSSIHIDDVRPIWEAEQRSLGSLQELQYFAKESCAHLGAILEPSETEAHDQNLILGKEPLLYKFPLNSINNQAIKQRFVDEEFKEGQIIDFNLLNRVSPFISTLAESMISEAMGDQENLLMGRPSNAVVLTGQEPAAESHNHNALARTSVACSPKVSKLTRLFLVRIRYQMRVAYNRQTRRFLMVEEVLPLAVQGNKNVSWLPREQAEDLLVNSQAQGNINMEVAKQRLSAALDFIQQPEQRDYLTALAQQRSQEIKDEHISVKRFTSEGSVVKVTPCDPYDIMGCYVLLPDMD